MAVGHLLQGSAEHYGWDGSREVSSRGGGPAGGRVQAGGSGRLLSVAGMSHCGAAKEGMVNPKHFPGSGGGWQGGKPASFEPGDPSQKAGSGVH